MTYEECMQIVNGQEEKPVAKASKRHFSRK